jgi:hypothetical protein
MSEAGAPAEAIALAVEEIEAMQAVIDARRVADRDRKREQREARKTAVVLGQSEDSPETVTGQSGTFPSPLDPPDVSPQTPLLNPPLSPNPEDLSVGTDPPLTADEVVEAWNTRMVPQGFPAVRRLTGHRQRQLAARLRENTIDDWRDAMSALEKSRFCKGDNDRGWRADFDFLLQPKSFTKLLEGAYP